MRGFGSELFKPLALHLIGDRINANFVRNIKAQTTALNRAVT